MVKMFKTIPQNVENPLTSREKIKISLHILGGGWYLDKFKKGLTPLKRTKLTEKAQERNYLIQKKLFEYNRWWNDWKFQLHWNMLEWVDPKSIPKRVKLFSVSSKSSMNNNDRTAHFVGHSKLTPLDSVDFYERKQNNENMETVTLPTLLR